MMRVTAARRFAAVLVVLIAAIGLVGVASVQPAAARPQEPMVIKAGDPITKTFPGIPGNYPGTAVAYWTPGGCMDPAFTWCDNIPLDIVRPDVDDATDWTVEIAVTWNPTETNKNDAQDAQACDLAVWLFDDTQIEGRTSEDPGYTALDSSDAAEQPEVVSTYAPELGRYNLVVLNFAGVNIDYTVTARMIIGHFEKPFEALGPTGGDRSGGPEESAFEETPPPDFSGEPSSSTRPLLNPDFAPSPLGEVAVLPDQDFGTFEETSSFDDQLRTPELPGGGFGNIRLRPPGDVPPAVLAFWFVLVPAVLAAAAWVVVVRRRSQLMSSALSG